MNAVTLPLPPARMVLATFREYTHVALLPLTIGGSAAAALGRLLFAWQVKTFTHRLPADARTQRRCSGGGGSFTLAVAVVIRGHLFVLAYFERRCLHRGRNGGFTASQHTGRVFLARSVFSTLMVLTAAPVVSNLAELFAGRFGWRSIAIVLLATAGYALFLKLPWAQWLRVQPAAQKIRPIYQRGSTSIMSTTGSDDLNSLVARASRHMTEIKASLERTMPDIEAAGSNVGASLQAKRDEAEARVEANRLEMEKADAEMNAYVDAKKATLDAAVAAWKAERNVERLEFRAQDAEAYAAAAVALASGAVDEANAAVLEATLWV
jgi:hypothetical protein